jgi:hypothetical protein
VLVLFDVCIGISQLLIDIHAVRGLNLLTARSLAYYNYFFITIIIVTALRDVFVERLTNREEELNLLLRNVRGLYSAEQEAVLGREFDLELAVLLLHTHPALRNPANQTSLSLESCNVSRSTRHTARL